MKSWLKNIAWQDLALPAFAILSFLALLFKLPTGVMDILLAANLAISASIFLTTFFVRKPLEFSSFPTVLLTTTLYRLVLNVSTTRLILTQGDAGRVVDAFSRFVAGDSVVVGGVIFLIFVVIQFVVITKGATRISEVTARFTLDALPGRQSAIDFDLNSGNITEAEAKALRAELSEQSDFFGAMDGASKFVRGDAIAGLVIVVINLIGGLCVGLIQNGMSISEAASLYARLTIGDGLVSQAPAFLISLATGLLVARTSREQNVSNEVLRQTFGRSVVLGATGVFLIFLSATGLPALPLLTMAAGILVLAWTTKRREDAARERAVASGAKGGGGKSGDDASKKEDEELEESLRVEPCVVAIGPGLASVALPEEGPTLLDRVKRARRELAASLGLILPKTRVVDDLTLDESHFVVRFNGLVAAQGVLYPQMLAAVDSGYAFSELKGLSLRAPGGKKGFWIEPDAERNALDEGYEIMTPGDLIEATLVEAATRDARLLLSRDAVKRLLDRLRETDPALVDEAIAPDDRDEARPRRAIAKIHAILRLLLAERVSIRRFDAILEAYNDLVLREDDPNEFRALEFIRVRIGKGIVAPFLSDDNELQAAILAPEWDDELREALRRRDTGEPYLALDSGRAKAFADALRAAANELDVLTAPRLLLTGGDLRYALSAFARDRGIDWTVVAYDETGQGARVLRQTFVEWK